MEEQPEEQAAAIAAMRAEWAQIGPEIMRADDPELLDDEQDSAVLRRAELWEGFLGRHQAALVAGKAPPEIYDLQGARDLKRDFLAAQKVAQEAAERSLQTTADLAESLQAVNELALEILAGMEAVPPEAWAGLSEERRQTEEDLLHKLQAARPKILETLPAERRRYWETR